MRLQCAPPANCYIDICLYLQIHCEERDRYGNTEEILIKLEPARIILFKSFAMVNAEIDCVCTTSFYQCMLAKSAATSWL